MNNSNSSMTITDSLAKLRSSRELPRSERNAIRSPMSVERVKEVKKHITVLQSLRAGSFEDVTVLGSQYRDHTGASSWYVAVWSEGISGFGSTVYQGGSYQITSIGPTERLCWKPSIYGNICQHRDQTKDALPSQESTYRPATQRVHRPLLWANSKVRGATLHRRGSLLELLSESKADFGW
jgi:hypothetical protein